MGTVATERLIDGAAAAAQGHPHPDLEFDCRSRPYSVSGWSRDDLA